MCQHSHIVTKSQSSNQPGKSSQNIRNGSKHLGKRGKFSYTSTNSNHSESSTSRVFRDLQDYDTDRNLQKLSVDLPKDTLKFLGFVSELQNTAGGLLLPETPEDISEGKLHKISKCGRYPFSNTDGVSLSQTNDKLLYSGLQTCKCAHSCPSCHARYMLTRKEEIQTAVTVLKDQEYPMYFVTLTIPNRKEHKEFMKTKLKVLNKARHYFFANSTIKKYMYSQITRHECTISTNGYHTHLHIIFVGNKETKRNKHNKIAQQDIRGFNLQNDTNKRELDRIWHYSVLKAVRKIYTRDRIVELDVKELRDKGKIKYRETPLSKEVRVSTLDADRIFKAVYEPNEHGLNIQKMVVENSTEFNKYISKMAIAEEMTSTHTKEGKGLTIFQLIRRNSVRYFDAEGNVSYWSLKQRKEIYKEYINAYNGVSIVRFGNKIRDIIKQYMYDNRDIDVNKDDHIFDNKVDLIHTAVAAHQWKAMKTNNLQVSSLAFIIENAETDEDFKMLYDNHVAPELDMLHEMQVAHVEAAKNILAEKAKIQLSKEALDSIETEEELLEYTNKVEESNWAKCKNLPTGNDFELPVKEVVKPVPEQKKFDF